MPGKRLRLVRSSTSFDDMLVLNGPLPVRELRLKMDTRLPPCYKMKVPMEVEEEKDYDADDDDEDASQPEIFTSSSLILKKMENEQMLGHAGNFLDRCNYCRKDLGEKDNIYMYSSLRAFCSSKCRKRQIVMDGILMREGILYGRQSTKEMVSLERMKIHNLTTTLL